jgi:membrane-associated protease RseP (regulator of RpoE activity)
MSYLGIFALLSLLIVIHELGHLAAARLAGVPLTLLGMFVLAVVMAYATGHDLIHYLTT